MKANTILIALVLFSSVALGQGQWSKQIGKIYDENKYREVVTIAGKISTYLSREDEKDVDDVVGRSYYALQMYDSAVYFENKAISLDNDASGTSGWAYAFRGMAEYRLGKKEESIADLQKAIDLNKTHNSVEVAKEFLGDVNTNSVPDDKCAFYFSQGEYKNAIEEGRRQLQKKEYKSVMQIMGAAYVNLHSYDSAIYFERKALAIDKDATLVSAWAHVNLGIALYNKNEKAQAIEELRKAIALDKTSNSVRRAENFLDGIISGRSLVIDSVHQAIKDQLISSSYRTGANIALAVISANPNDALACDQLSSAYCWLHSYDSSIYYGQKAIALDNEQTMISCESHYNIGIDRFMKNDRQAAEDEFTAAMNDRTSDNLKKKLNRTRTLMGLDDHYDHWKTVERDNIIFHFQNKRSIDADALMDKYEKEYANAHSALPVQLPKKIDLFVWERDALAKNALQSEGDLGYTNADFCLTHVADDNNRSTQIVRILGYWQKGQ
jgi:tetratricopeptide (TPR) repeat protein